MDLQTFHTYEGVAGLIDVILYIPWYNTHEFDMWFDEWDILLFRFFFISDELDLIFWYFWHIDIFSR